VLVAFGRRKLTVASAFSLYREVAMELIEEYQACEKADYIVRVFQPFSWDQD
jgi:hypothetical protein